VCGPASCRQAEGEYRIAAAVRELRASHLSFGRDLRLGFQAEGLGGFGKILGLFLLTRKLLGYLIRV
jgi:hypothetical protein